MAEVDGVKFLIVGANSDVAKSLSRLLASKGNDLILLSRDRSELELQENDLKTRYNSNVIVEPFDILDVGKFEEIFTKYKDVDCLIYVAGYLGDNQIALNSLEESDRIMRVNYLNAVLFINKFALEFEERKKGIIVGFSSVAGDRGKGSNFIYGSAKGGFAIYLQGLRNKLFKSGVKVITVKPGFIDTKMTENMKLPPMLTSTPEKVARDVYGAISKGKDIKYTKWFWRWLMLIICLIPERIFKKLNM